MIKNLMTKSLAGASAALASAGASAGASTGSGAVETVVQTGDLPTAVLIVVNVGIVSVFVGMMLCVYRLLRGPHLADRVLAGDTLSLHVVALVILLAVRLQTAIFFDAVLVVAIIGFASTLAFAQYIGNQKSKREVDADKAKPEETGS